MHDGSLAALKDVVNYYLNTDLERLHSYGERIPEPLKLSDQETSESVSFLEELSYPVKN